MKGQFKGLGKTGLQRDELAATDRVTISISMSRADLELLDQRARGHGVERSSIVRRLIRDGYISTCSVCRMPTSMCKCCEVKP